MKCLSSTEYGTALNNINSTKFVLYWQYVFQHHKAISRTNTTDCIYIINLQLRTYKIDCLKPKIF